MLRNPFLREGNSNRSDPCTAAKRQYLLGVLVQERDRLENKHDRWQALSEDDSPGRWLDRSLAAPHFGRGKEATALAQPNSR